MKNLWKAVAFVIAIGFACFGIASCGSDDDGGDDVTYTDYTWVVDETSASSMNIDAGTYTITCGSDGNFTTKFGDATVASGTYKKDGTTLKATVKKSVGSSGELSELDADNQYVLVFTVGDNNVLTLTGKEDVEPEAESKTYAWTFNDIKKSDIGAEDAGGEYAGKWVLAADYKYSSTPSGLKLTMGKGDASQGFVYNTIDDEKTIGESSQTVIYGKATKGAVEPAGDLLSIPNLKGPFTVEVYVSSNSSSDKTDRYAYIKVGAEGSEEEVCAPTKSSNTVPVAGQILSYEYTGNDKVNVIIGCAKYLRVYDVKVTTAATQDQSINVAFNSSTATLENTVAKLGLVGTSVSASGSFAEASIADGVITVTSKAEGVETFTVTDANSKTASFKAIVAEDGAVSIGTVTKYEVPAPVSGTDFETVAAATPTITAKVSGLEYSTSSDGDFTALDVDVVVNLSAGTKYYVRFAAVSGVYDAGKTAEFTASDGATVDASWTFTADSAADAPWFVELIANTESFELESGSTTKGKIKADKTATVTPTTGGRATLTFQRTGQSIESGGANGWKISTKAPADYIAHITITVTDSCVVTISGKDGGASKTDGTVRGFVVNDGADDVVSYTQEGSASATFSKSFSAVSGKTYTLKAGGVNIYSISCATAD